MLTGQTVQLTATVSPANVKQNIRWFVKNTSYDKPAYAIVDKKGVIHAYKEGTAVIAVVTDNGKRAEITVNIFGEQVYSNMVLNVANIINDNRRGAKVAELPIDAAKTKIAQDEAERFIAEKAETSVKSYSYHFDIAFNELQHWMINSDLMSSASMKAKVCEEKLESLGIGIVDRGLRGGYLIIYEL